MDTCYYSRIFSAGFLLIHLHRLRTSITQLESLTKAMHVTVTLFRLRIDLMLTSISIILHYVTILHIAPHNIFFVFHSSYFFIISYSYNYLLMLLIILLFILVMHANQFHATIATFIHVIEIYYHYSPCSLLIPSRVTQSNQKIV